MCDTRSKSSKSQHVHNWLKILVFAMHCSYGMNSVTTIDPDLRYILIWTPHDGFPFSAWKKGQETFIEKGCEHSNCFVVTREESTDVFMFDAIVFNGRNLDSMLQIVAPPIRFPFQNYIFFNSDSADNSPACHPSFDNFFNLTATYKLDSDILFSYIEIRKDGVRVGPKKDMVWLDRMHPIKPKKHENKTKAVAWFVSNCYTRNHREKYAKSLHFALAKLNLTLDVFGSCSKVDCPNNKCSELLNKYYFYLAFENSFSEDYVTEKLLTALNNDTVPIVYGGANYSRFLPPGSYLDAGRHSPEQMATIIEYKIANPVEYNDFFSWKKHYSYHEPDNDCSFRDIFERRIYPTGAFAPVDPNTFFRLCAALNNDNLISTDNVYRDFRGWWNSDFRQRCIEHVTKKNYLEFI